MGCFVSLKTPTNLSLHEIHSFALPLFAAGELAHRFLFQPIRKIRRRKKHSHWLLVAVTASNRINRYGNYLTKQTESPKNKYIELKVFRQTPFFQPLVGLTYPSRWGVFKNIHEKKLGLNTVLIYRNSIQTRDSG